MKIGVVQFPGSNCERETKLALERIGYTPVDCFWNSKPDLLESLDGFIIVGGFSYEDRVRSGLIASKDPFMKLLAKEAAKGKPILGICNGAQILVESGLIGGPIALTHNKRMREGKLIGTGFYNDWVEIQSNKAPTDQPIRLPIAHAEGRFLLDDTFYQTLQQAGATFYTYCDENPNGSMHNLASVSNAAGNIMAMMPHPERTPAGDIILKTFFASVIPAQAGIQQSEAGGLDSRLRGNDKRIKFMPYQLNPNAHHYWVSLMIHDNEAISLENTLQQLGKPVKLKKLIHFEITGIEAKDKNLIQETDELFNRQKEYLTEPKTQHAYIIRAFEDEIAQSKQEALSKILQKPVKVKREVVWCTSEPLDAETCAILGNPLSHEGFTL